MSVPFAIRTARPADSQSVHALARNSVDEIQGPFANRRLGSDIPASAFCNCAVFVAEAAINLQIIGFISIRLDNITESLQSHALRAASISMLGVVPEMRRNGIGRQLLQHATDFAKEQKIERLTLDVDEHNSGAIALYEKLGWIPIDRRMAYKL